MHTSPLLTEQQVYQLKQELNFLLWTDDIPEYPAELEAIVQEQQIEKTRVNLNCTSHAIVTSSLFFARGYSVITRCGSAYIFERSPDGRQENDRFDQILKHAWMTIDGHGLVDLSLNAENEHPLIYCNRSHGNRWKVEFGRGRSQLDQFFQAREQGCLYLTVAKKRLVPQSMLQLLSQPFRPAKERGIALVYSAILKHASELVNGTSSLVGVAQVDAWRELAQRHHGDPETTP